MSDNKKHREVEAYETYYPEHFTEPEPSFADDECTCAKCTHPPCPGCTEGAINDALGG